MKTSNFSKIESSPTVFGIPVCHYKSHLSSFEDKYSDKFIFEKLEQVVEVVLSADIANCPRYIVLCGSPGSGKTHFMVGLYRALVQKLGFLQGEGAFFTTFTYLAEEIISLFSQSIPLRTSLATYEQAKWLFVDDFTATERIFKQDSLEFNIFRDILIDRHETNSTLITSCNLSAIDFLSEMDRLFGNYITSRLNGGKIVQFPNVDFRKIRKI